MESYKHKDFPDWRIFPGIDKHLFNALRSRMDVMISFVKEVCKFFEISTDEIFSPCRERRLAYPRHLIFYCLLKRFGPETGPTELRKLTLKFDEKGRDHSSVIHARKAIENKLDIAEKYNHEAFVIKDVDYLMKKLEF